MGGGLGIAKAVWLVIKDGSVKILKSLQEGYHARPPQLQFETFTVHLHISYFRCRWNTYFVEKMCYHQEGSINLTEKRVVVWSSSHHACCEDMCSGWSGSELWNKSAEQL